MALVTQSNSGAAFSSLLAPFTSVATATVRPLKGISAAELATLREGDTVYVISLRDYFKWLPTSVIANDAINNTYVTPTIVGAGAGRFERLLRASPDWMLQTTWIIDAAASLGTSNNENDGLTAATALLTDTERQFRMGEQPIWSLGAYHLRYISDVPATQEVAIKNRTAAAGQIFMHGSMTDGQGQSILFGPATMGAITALNYAAAAGGQPWEMICATIPVSWATAGPAGTSLINKRGRVTAGIAANVGGKFWPIKDLGGAAPNAKTRLAEPNRIGTYTAPFSTTIPTATFTPTAGDTFVIEKLTLIPLLSVDMHGGANSAAINGIIFDSLEVGTGARWQCSGNRVAIFDGCIKDIANFAELSTAFVDLGCQFSNGTQPLSPTWTIANGYTRASTPVFHCVESGSFTRFMAQAPTAGSATMRISCSSGVLSNGSRGWTINQIGSWDSTTDFPLRIVGSSVLLAATATLWGGNNTFEPVKIVSKGQLAYLAAPAALPNSYFFIVGGGLGAWASCEARTSIPAFDLATSLYTAPRLISPANLQTTVALGGFGGLFNDPVTGSEFSQRT
jgi:hypothetical protein